MSCDCNSYVNGKIVKIILNNPLMNKKNITKIIHKHKYTEFHLIFGGSAKVFIENNEYMFLSGSIFSVPNETYHCYMDIEPQTQVVAFQADVPLKSFEKHFVSQDIIEKIIEILKKENYNCYEISALFSFTVSKFFPSELMKRSKDYAALIYEFISKKYNQNIKISELAEELHLSVKQTERLVKKYTGYTFKKAIMNCRINVAEFLEKNTDMSKSEISEYVGYSNYSGYWKTKKYFE